MIYLIYIILIFQIVLIFLIAILIKKVKNQMINTIDGNDLVNKINRLPHRLKEV